MRKKKLLLVIATLIVVTAGLPIGGFEICKTLGRNRMQDRIDTSPNQVKYQNILYEYNTNLITFLVMGIDKGKETYEPWEVDDGGRGQADALFLAVLNMESETLQIIGINRNTMTDIDFYDDGGNYLATFPAQIALQHAYGMNDRESCTYQMKAVKNLFYHLPIHGYVSVNIDAIPTLNDAIGGVDVDVLEDLTGKSEELVKGRRVHLIGEDAYWYVKYRDIDIFASVDMRMSRQAQYLNNFIDTAKQSLKKEPLAALQLYQELAPQMETDVSLSEIVYLASVLPKYQFDEHSFYRVEGETIMGEEFEEFYPDEASLFELILNIFYKKVEESE